MSKPDSLPVVKLSDLKPGSQGTFFAMLAERTPSLTRDNKPYFSCRFRDSRRSVSYMVWHNSDFFQACDASWKRGQIYKIHAALIEREKFGLQIEIIKIRPVEDRDREEGFNPADFIDHSRFDPAKQFEELQKLITDTMTDVPLKKMTLGLLEKHAEVLKVIPATTRTFYPFPGGWIEHVLNVSRHAVWMVDRYREHYPKLVPPLNKDLVLAGAVLHDIGRALEIVPGQDLCDPVSTSVDGFLTGHLILGRDMVREAAREQGDVNPELVRMLEHIVLTHLTLPEWGSPRLPAIPEAVLIHHIDDLDAKMEMYARCLTNDKADGAFTERDPVLAKPLFKGRTV